MTTKGNRKDQTKKILTIILTAILVFSCSGVAAYAELSSAAVDIVIKGTKGGTVTITRADGSTDSNCRSALKVPESGLTFTFTHDMPSGSENVDTYDYIIKQAKSPRKPNYIYDDSVYTARVYVGHLDGNRASSIMILDKNGDPDKPDKIRFVNKDNGNIHTNTSDPTDPSKKKHSRTGDRFSMIYLAAFLLADVVLIGFIYIRRRTREDN